MRKIYASLIMVLVFAVSQAQVSVTATAGTTGPTAYTTISAAFAKINDGTHKGQITISITGDVTEPADPTPLYSSTSPASYTSISIVPAGGSWKVYCPTKTDNTVMIDLAGADNVTVDGDPLSTGTRNLTFEIATSETSRTAVFRLSSKAADNSDGAKNNTIKNCVIIGSRFSSTATLNTYGIYMGGTYSSVSISNLSAYDCTGNKFDNNLIKRCQQGIVVSGNSAYPAENLFIRKNRIGAETDAENIGQIAVNLANTSALGNGGAIIEENEITCGAASTSGSNAPNVSLRGISAAQGCANSFIRKNKVHDIITTDGGTSASANGIILSTATSSTGIRIENNFISNVVATKATVASLDVTTGAFGIMLNAALTDVRINYNTIALIKTPTVGTETNYFTACVDLNNASSAILSEFRNNNLVNSNTGANAFAIRARAAANVSTAIMDYNNYKCSGTYLANYAGTNNADLAAWQTSSSKDANSISADPLFAGAADFHLGSSSPLINKATPIATITIDIDGDTRAASTPDIGADEFTSSLPVTYASLSAKRNSDGNLLSWKTYTESNNLGFELQRSSDGYNYTAIAFVNTKAPNGNSNTPLMYEYTDRKPTGTKQYYRLLQKDANGNSRLGNVVMLNVNQSTGLLGTYPNPVLSALFLQLYSEKNTNAKVLVMDASGKPVMQQNTRLEQGSNTSSIHVATLPKGYYSLVITIEGSDKTFSTKFIKQ